MTLRDKLNKFTSNDKSKSSFSQSASSPKRHNQARSERSEYSQYSERSASSAGSEHSTRSGHSAHTARPTRSAHSDHATHSDFSTHGDHTAHTTYSTYETPGDGARHSQENAQSEGESRHYPSAASYARSQGNTRTGRPNIPNPFNPLVRLSNKWFNRIMGAVSEGGLAEQEEEYAAHRTSRDYIWNSIGVGVWGCVFPVLTVIATQLVGAEQAGMFSMAFVTATLLMIIANFGVRTYQISDLSEKHSFNDYQIHRWITCVLMVFVGVAYCAFRGYGEEMFYLSMGVYIYKMVDGLADVYEGRLQQADKLYLAGVSQTLRSIFALVAFSLLLLITKNMVAACIAMAIGAIISFVVITFPLSLLETPKSKRWSVSSIGVLFKNCFPLFIALFLYALIDNMPKFVMEGTLSYDNQLYFNALYFPAQGILLTAQLIYKPMLVRMAEVWHDPAKRKRFDLIVIGMFVLIVGITVVNVIVMGWIGIPIMSILYGLDFEQFRGLMYIMLAAGGITATIDFLYQTITVLRRQKDVMMLYVVTFGFSVFIPILLVNFTGLPGAVIGYLIVMCLLMVLLIWEYFRIRQDLNNNKKDQAQAFSRKATAR